MIRELVRMHAVVRGRVQMVGYRMFVERTVGRIGSISGTVHNRSDGSSVEVIAEGPQHCLEALLDELRVGPAHALVRDVDVAWHESTGEFDGFATVI